MLVINTLKPIRQPLEQVLPALVLAGVALVIYHPVLLQCYGIQDDYAYLWVATFEHWHFFDLIGAMGRPVYQWLSAWMYGQFDTLCALNNIRFLTLISAWVLGLQGYYLARRYQWPVSTALTLAVCWLTAPAIGLIVAWSITFPFLFALSISLVAGELVSEVISKHDRRGWLIALAALLLFIALSIYQHAAMGYWLAVALFCFPAHSFRWPGWPLIWLWNGLFLGVLVAYYLTYQLYLDYLTGLNTLNLHAAERAGLSVDIIGKLKFLFESVQLALSVGQFRVWFWWASAVAGLISLTVLWHSWQQRSIWPLVFVLALIVAVYLPSLIVHESLLKVRLLIVLSLLVLFFLVWALQYWLDGKWLIAASLGLSIYLGFSEARSIDRLVALNQAEAEAVRTALVQHYTASSQQIAIIRPVPGNWDGGATWLIEYGTPTMATWADFASVLVQQLFAETFQTRHLPEVLQCPEPAQQDCPELLASDLPVLDLGRLLQEQLTRTGFKSAVQ